MPIAWLWKEENWLKCQLNHVYVNAGHANLIHKLRSEVWEKHQKCLHNSEKYANLHEVQWVVQKLWIEIYDETLIKSPTKAYNVKFEEQEAEHHRVDGIEHQHKEV